MPNTGDIVKASDFQAIKPQLSIGTVTTGAAGTNASASITGTSPNFKLNLTIPRGNTGAAGTNGKNGSEGILVLTTSTTITVPSGVKGALISGCGGGGGADTYNPGVCGGGGGSVIDYYVSCTPNTSIRCTIGTGGRTGTLNGSTSGGVTSFGNLISLGGGSGGGSSGRGSVGTSPGVNLSSSGSDDYGGSTPFGRGGRNGRNSTDNGEIPTGYGAGGSFGSYTTTTRNGTNGILIIKWVNA